MTQFRYLKISFGVLVIGSVLPVASSADQEVPARYERVILREPAYEPSPISNLMYEGNNIGWRGSYSHGLVELTSEAVAKRYRMIAPRTHGLFVLRDSIFSQQDHPYRQTPYAFMLPPNWITAAVVAQALTPSRAFPVEDDQAWSHIRSESDLFGSFPPSENLFKLATTPLQGKPASEQAQIRNVRTTLEVLAKDSTQLVEAGKAGSREDIIRTGAELIAQSDIRYFTEPVRRRSIILVMVENPMSFELMEAKSHFIYGHPVDKAVTDQVRNIVYHRRLEQGDIALEHYDISKPAEVERAIDVLEGLIPRGGTPSGQGNVWLWVTGPLTPRIATHDTEVYVGKDATPYIAAFRERLRQSRIDLTRLRLLSKPSIHISRTDRANFEKEVDRFAGLDMPMSSFLSTDDLTALLQLPKPER